MHGELILEQTLGKVLRDIDTYINFKLITVELLLLALLIYFLRSYTWLVYMYMDVVLIII